MESDPYANSASYPNDEMFGSVILRNYSQSQLKTSTDVQGLPLNLGSQLLSKYPPPGGSNNMHRDASRSSIKLFEKYISTKPSKQGQITPLDKVGNDQIRSQTLLEIDQFDKKNNFKNLDTAYLLKKVPKIMNHTESMKTLDVGFLKNKKEICKHLKDLDDKCYLPEQRQVRENVSKYIDLFSHLKMARPDEYVGTESPKSKGARGFGNKKAYMSMENIQRRSS